MATAAHSLNVTFDTLPRTQRPSRPTLRRLATTVESPAGCIRKGCKCDYTDAGFKIITSATTHIECPLTTMKSVHAELASPRRFYRFIMEPRVDIGDIDRRILNQFMLDCFESPFESPSDTRLQNKMKVKVELSKDFGLRARDQLSMIPGRFWHQLSVHGIVNACVGMFDQKIRVQVQPRETCGHKLDSPC